MDKNNVPTLTAGVDLGDKQSTICVLDASGATILEEVVKTSRRGFERFFAKRERMRVAIETGTHTPWIHDLLVHKGHEVIVANARQLELISKNDRKNDRNDARLLASSRASTPSCCLRSKCVIRRFARTSRRCVLATAWCEPERISSTPFGGS